MPISSVFIGMHAINNSWSSGSPAHQGITNQMLFQLAADGGSNIIRVPLDLSVVGPSGPPQWVVDSIGTVLQQAASLGLKVILEPGQTPPDLLPAGAPLSQAPDTDAGVEALLASTYNQITGTAGDDYVEGTSGDERILGGDGEDTLYGGAGDDVLQGQGGAYNQADYDGGPGDYTFVRNDNDTVTVTSAAWGTDTLTEIDGVWFRGAGQWYAIEDLFGSSGTGDTIVGSAGDDFLPGTSGADTILGGDGNDTLYGYLGDDLIDGQAGTYNQADYDGAAADYLFNREVGGSVTVSHAVYGTDTLRNVDGVWFYGEERWYSLDALAPELEIVQQANRFATRSGLRSHLTEDLGGGSSSAAPKSGDNRPEIVTDDKDDMLVVLIDMVGKYIPPSYEGINKNNISTEKKYIRSEDVVDVYPEGIPENLAYAPGDNWFEPEPIGGLI